MPVPVIETATRIWESNVFWSVNDQCGVWDVKGKGVDIWECIRDHHSTHTTQPPNGLYWRYIARR